ncbi:MAG: hypothetical protein MMC33_003486 [Icmadophila ericetorum]|nr:hypothetical protein [Icmadophila ericetorum]
MFSPLAFPSGLVVYEMMTYSPTPAQLALVPFELYREPLVILAIAEGRELVGDDKGENESVLSEGVSGGDVQSAASDDALDSVLRSVMELKEQYSTALVHQVFVFNCDKPEIAFPPSVVPVPSLENSKTTTMKTLMCDLTSQLLAEMTSYARSLQALPNIETPKPIYNEGSQIDGHNSSRPGSRISSLPGSRSSSPVPEPERKKNRQSMLPQVNSVSEARSREGSRTRPQSAIYSTPPLTFDEINGVSGRSTPASTSEQERPRRLSREKIQVQGFGSGSVGERARNKAKGRIGVVIGSMYLLAGRWPDAIKELVEGAAVARANSDHVWHAKALDYILVCMIMCAWGGMDFEIPQICYPLGDKALSTPKSSKNTPTHSAPDLTSPVPGNSTNRLVSLQNLCQLLPDLVNNILHLYVRAATFTADLLPQICFSESTIRFSKLLAIIQASHGTLNDHGLRRVVLNADEERSQDTIPIQFTSFPTRAEIAAVVFRAMPLSIAEKLLDVADRVVILAGIASVLSVLGYHRKKAFVLRELTSALLPALVQSRKDSAADLGVHPAASLSSFDLNKYGTGLEEDFSGQDGSENGTQGFLSMLSQVYGVVSADSSENKIITSGKQARLSPNDRPTNPARIVEAVGNRAIRQAVLRSFGNQVLKLDILRTCINVCEALPDFQGVLRFSSDLLRTVGSGIAPAGDSSDGAPMLPIEDQVRLSQNILRTVGAAKQLGMEHLMTEYWDEFLLRKVEIAKPILALTPTTRDQADLKVASGLSIEKEKSPFLFNPFSKKADSSAADIVLVANEEAYFTAVVQNLYDFDLEIEWIKLDTSDTTFEAKADNVMIGPYRTQAIQMNGKPKHSGALKVEGCIAKIRGCHERRFPIYEKPWKYKQSVKAKRLGLAASTIETTRPVSVTSDLTRSQRRSVLKGPDPSNLSAKVIPPQPVVVAHAVSSTQSAIMLLEGERKRVKFTLQNTSSTTPVDLLLLAFTDSTSPSLQHALANKDISAAEIYEAELFSYRQEALRWIRVDDHSEPSIPPNGELTIEIEVLGKPGLTYGTVQIDYGHLGVPRSEVSGQFYTRQVIVPFTVTVNASVSLAQDDFLPFTGDFAWHNQRNQSNLNNSAPSTQPDKRLRAFSRAAPEVKNRFQSLLQRLGLGAQGDDHCLLLLDFHNSWPTPLRLSVQVRENLSKEPANPDDHWKRAYTVYEIIQPGHTTRTVLLIPRLSVQNPYASIPSLNPANKRQYVVSSSKVSPEAELASREAFWYREEILKYLRATWEEESTGRKGDIELRNLRLSARMIDAIKLEEIGIEMTLSPAFPEEEGEGSPSTETETVVTQTGRSKFLVPQETFLFLKTRVKNRLPHPIHPLLRLQPALRHHPYNIALDLSKKFAFNGLLQQALPLLEAGEETEVELGCVFLCEGEFEVHAIVEEVRVWKPPLEDEEGKGKGGRKRAMTGDLVGDKALAGRTERRIWGCREPCVVFVRGAVDGSEEEEKRESGSGEG